MPSLIGSLPVRPLPPALERKGADSSREVAPPEPPTTRDAWPVNAPRTLARSLPAPEQAVIDAALAILSRHAREPGAMVDSPGVARELVRVHLAQCGRERFGVLFLSGQHDVIAFEVLFEGTLTQTSVYPREVVRRALQLNAAAVILAHNHPSGQAEPSRADEHLTHSLRAALGLVDVAVLDHLVVGWPSITSMAERGLMGWTGAIQPAPATRRVRATAKRTVSSAAS